jgi:hypothetical protein
VALYQMGYIGSVNTWNYALAACANWPCAKAKPSSCHTNVEIRNRSCYTAEDSDKCRCMDTACDCAEGHERRSPS